MKNNNRMGIISLRKFYNPYNILLSLISFCLITTKDE